MSTPDTETNIGEIARALTTRRNRGQRTVLFLGARAGGLFRNEDFYEILKNFSLWSFDNLNNLDKFAECYKVLNSKLFKENETDTILMSALRNLHHREEDEPLVGLVKAGFFDIILTTNIDSLLEDTCVLWGMREPDNYRVIVHGVQDKAKITDSEPGNCRIVKVFGDLNLRYNTIGREFDLEADKEFKKFLASNLRRDVLIVGYDPYWDRPVEQAFPTTGGALWYVNEDPPPQDTYLARVLEQRKGRYQEEIQGSYGAFWRSLYDSIGEGASQRREVVPLQPGGENVSQKSDAWSFFRRLWLFFRRLRPRSSTTKRVFISYSRKDKQYLDRLEKYLKKYLPEDSKRDSLNIVAGNIWPDLKMESREVWSEKIKKTLADAKIAILLVSADFLASDRIRDYELPILLDAAKEGEVRLLSVVVGPCAFKYTKLYNYPMINSLAEPLMGMAPYEQEIVWAKLAHQVHNILNSQP